MRHLFVVALLLGAPKPVSVCADKSMDDASWIAEAVVLEVQPAEWGNDKQGSIRVRVTTDPDRVFKGFDRIGREIDLKPPSWGPADCTANLAAAAKAGTPLLVVADKDGRIPLVGQALEKSDDPAYRLRSWCDFNAWWIYSNDAKFGKSVPCEPMTTIEVTVAAVAERYRKESAGFLLKQARFLAGAQPEISDDDLARRVRELGSDDVETREAATTDLAKRAAWNIEGLRRAAASTDDSEVKARVEKVLAAFAEHAAAFDAALAARKRGPADEIRLLRTALTVADDALKPRLTERLRELEKP